MLLIQKLFLLFFLSAQIYYAQPDTFNLLIPSNGGWANATPLFDWSTSSNVDYYQLYIAGALLKDSITTSSYQTTENENLIEGLHTWYVNAVNNSGTTKSTQTWSVWIDIQNPEEFNLSAPSNQDWVATDTPTFSWSPSTDAESGLAKYQIYIDNVLFADNIPASQTEYTLMKVLSNGLHTWSITAIDNAGNLTNSLQTNNINIDNIPPFGDFNKCGGFLSGDVELTVKHNSSLDFTDNLTIELWVLKKYEASSNRNLIQKFTGNYPFFKGFSIQVTRHNNIYIQLNNLSYSSTQILEIEYWYHIAVVFSKATGVCRLYINGKLDKSVSGMNYSVISNDLEIGQRGSSDFYGYMDEIRIWDSVRSEEEIKYYKDISINDSNQNLKAYWKFNQISGYDIKDLSYNDNDAKIIGSLTLHDTDLPIGLMISKLITPTNDKYVGPMNNLLKFIWGTVIDTGIGFKSHSLKIDSNPIYVGTDTSTVLSESINLSYGQHSWFVESEDMLGNTSKSIVETFRYDNKSPYPFNLLEPINDQFVNMPTPEFKWEKKGDSGSQMMKYQLWINDTLNIDNIPSYTGSTAPSLPLPQGKYTWYIKAYDNVYNYTQSTNTGIFYVDYEAPQNFSLIFPNDGDTVKTHKPTFMWNPSIDIGSGIAKYELVISNGTPITIPASDTSFTVSYELPDGEYNWYIKAYDKAGKTTNSNTNTFVVNVPVPPNAPILSWPLNYSTIFNDLTPDFGWSTTENTNYYHVQVSTDSLFTTIIAEDNHKQNSFFTPFLDSYGNYYWRVKAHGMNETWSEWSEVWSLNIFLESPTLIYPMNESNNLDINIYLSWEKLDSLSNYIVELDTNSNFNSPLKYSATTTDTSHQISNLKNNKKYYWHVKASNDAGESIYSNTWFFITIIDTPTVVVLQSPANDSEGNFKPIMLIWNKSYFANSYTLQLSTYENFTTTLLDSNGLIDTSYILNELNDSTTYYWRVNSSNISGTSNWSNIWSFTTLGIPNPPTLISPDNSTELSDTTNSIEFVWGSVELVDSYTLETSTNESFDSLFVNINDLTDTNYVYSNRLIPGTFYWRVNAKNQVGVGTWSNIYSFTITLTDVDRLGSTIPQEFVLEQNYPNPFNPSTMVKYGLPEQSNIKIEIFNMLGQSVGVLVNAEKQAGFYETTWNAENLPSGIYLISIRAEGLSSKKNFVQVKKALLLK